MPSNTTTAEPERAYWSSWITYSLGDFPYVADSAEIAVRTERTFVALFASSAEERYEDKETKPMAASTARTAMTTMSSARLKAENFLREEVRSARATRADTESETEVRFESAIDIRKSLKSR